MQLQGSALVVNAKKFGDLSLIITILAEEHGFYSGLIKIDKERKKATACQPGSFVEVVWRSRLAENLGMFTKIELVKALPLPIFANRARLLGLQSILALFKFLPEKQQEQDLFQSLHSVIYSSLTDEEWYVAYIKLELLFLSALGVGLDLSECVVTKSQLDMHYISPKSGKAVSKAVGAPYHSKLLPYPELYFGVLSQETILEALRVNEFFIKKHLNLHNHSWAKSRKSLYLYIEGA